MQKIETFFKNITTDENDYYRLVNQIKDIFFGNKSIYFLHGSGNNGKSVLQQLIRNLIEQNFGENSYLHVPENLITQGAHSNYYVNMSQIANAKYLNINEFDDYQKINIGKLKELTGGDSIYYKGNILNSQKKKIIILSNSNPEYYLEDHKQDAGFLHRLSVIPFKKTIDNPDQEFCDDILNNHIDDFISFLTNFDNIENYQNELNDEINEIEEDDYIKFILGKSGEDIDYLQILENSNYELNIDL